MVLALTTLALIAGAVAADDPNLRTRGSLWTLGAVDLGNEVDQEDVVEALSRFALEARWNTPTGGRVLMSVAGEHWLQSGPDTRVRVDAWPDEIRWDRPLASWAHLRLGQQVARWGQLEGITLVDVLNPRDLRHGPMYAPDEQRIAVPMARLELGPPVARLQLYAIPWHVPNRYHMVGSDWAFFPTGLVEDMVSTVGSWEGDPTTAALMGEVVAGLEQHISDADPAAWWGYDTLFRSAGDRWRPLDGLEGAARFKVSGASADFSLMGARVRADQPTVAMDPQLMEWIWYRSWPDLTTFQAWAQEADGLVTTDYPYTWMAGADAAATVGVVGLKLEGVYTTHQALTTSFLEADSSPEVGVGVSAEYQGSTTLRFGVEAAWKRLLDVEAGRGLLARREDEGMVAGWFTLSLFRQRVEPELTAVWSPTFEEGVACANISWQPGDRWAISAHTWFFFARARTPRTIDDLILYDGGPMGLYSDNDAAALKFTWYL